MRELMRELTLKRPTDEWRLRMERMHTALDLSERDNARMRAELARMAAVADSAGGASPSSAASSAVAAAAAAAAAAASGGGLSEALLARHEALQSEAAQTEEALRLARRSAASQEAYLAVLQSEAQEAAARNEAQQRRLELLTAENSKLKKESTKLRSEVTGARMANFEHDILTQELRGAKDAAAAMEAQLQRLHAENAALREGGGMRDELALATQQLRDALDAKAQLQLALTAQVRRAHAEVSVAVAAVASADGDLDAAAQKAQQHEARAVAARERQLRAGALMASASRLDVASDERALRWALQAWADALRFSVLVGVFCEVGERVRELGDASVYMEGEIERLQLAETGGLAINQLQLLHETSKEVMQSEMAAAEEAAHANASRHATAASRLRKREDDLVLLLQSYEALRDKHAALAQRVAKAADGSAAHAARLEGDAEQLRGVAHERAEEISALRQREELLTGQLGMRERQLALLVTHLEASRTESDALRTRGSVEEQQLRAQLEEHSMHLVHLVRELYELATAERVPGAVAHDARSRVFRRCARASRA